MQVADTRVEIHESDEQPTQAAQPAKAAPITQVPGPAKATPLPKESEFARAPQMGKVPAPAKSTPLSKEPASAKSSPLSKKPQPAKASPPTKVSSPAKAPQSAKASSPTKAPKSAKAPLPAKPSAAASQSSQKTGSSTAAANVAFATPAHDEFHDQQAADFELPGPPQNHVAQAGNELPPQEKPVRAEASGSAEQENDSSSSGTELSSLSSLYSLSRSLVEEDEVEEDEVDTDTLCFVLSPTKAEEDEE